MTINPYRTFKQSITDALEEWRSADMKKPNTMVISKKQR